MFYTIEKMDHGLPHDPFKAIVAPRYGSPKRSGTTQNAASAVPTHKVAMSNAVWRDTSAVIEALASSSCAAIRGKRINPASAGRRIKASAPWTATP